LNTLLLLAAVVAVQVLLAVVVAQGDSELPQVFQFLQDRPLPSQ
jgi:hypothetical protein